jgi:spermidine synthase
LDGRERPRNGQIQGNYEFGDGYVFTSGLATTLSHMMMMTMMMTMMMVMTVSPLQTVLILGVGYTNYITEIFANLCMHVN